MIDKTHLRRIMNYCEDFDLRKTDAYLPLAQAIWREAQEEERERCAKIADKFDETADYGAGDAIRKGANRET